MHQARYRKYPIVYEKKHKDGEEKSIDLSLAAAVGVLAFAFVKGMFWGYVLRKKLE